MNEYTKDKPTSEQLVDLLDNELEMTICTDVVHGLDYEYKKMQHENKKLKDNWNKLKEIAKSQSGLKKQADLKGGLWFEVDELLEKMQELEQGSDNQ